MRSIKFTAVFLFEFLILGLLGKVDSIFDQVDVLRRNNCMQNGGRTNEGKQSGQQGNGDDSCSLGEEIQRSGKIPNSSGGEIDPECRGPQIPKRRIYETRDDSCREREDSCRESQGNRRQNVIPFRTNEREFTRELLSNTGNEKGHASDTNIHNNFTEKDECIRKGFNRGRSDKDESRSSGGDTENFFRERERGDSGVARAFEGTEGTDLVGSSEQKYQEEQNNRILQSRCTERKSIARAGKGPDCSSSNEESTEEYLYRRGEEGCSIVHRPQLHMLQETKDCIREGEKTGDSQLVSICKFQRQICEPGQDHRGESDIRHSGKDTASHISYFSNSSTDPVQQGGRRLLSEDTEITEYKTYREQGKEIQSARDYPPSAPILKQLLQGIGPCNAFGSTGCNNISDTVEGRGISTDEISKPIETEEGVTQHQEGPKILSTSEIDVQNNKECIICKSTFKTESNYIRHLTSKGHISNLNKKNTPLRVNQPRPHLQPLFPGIQSLLDAERGLSLNYDDVLLRNVLLRDDY